MQRDLFLTHRRLIVSDGVNGKVNVEVKLKLLGNTVFVFDVRRQVLIPQLEEQISFAFMVKLQHLRLQKQTY